jgi:hypothetical protein
MAMSIPLSISIACSRRARCPSRSAEPRLTLGEFIPRVAATYLFKLFSLHLKTVGVPPPLPLLLPTVSSRPAPDRAHAVRPRAAGATAVGADVTGVAVGAVAARFPPPGSPPRAGQPATGLSAADCHSRLGVRHRLGRGLPADRGQRQGGVRRGGGALARGGRNPNA